MNANEHEWNPNERAQTNGGISMNEHKWRAIGYVRYLLIDTRPDSWPPGPHRQRSTLQAAWPVHRRHWCGPRILTPGPHIREHPELSLRGSSFKCMTTGLINWLVPVVKYAYNPYIARRVCLLTFLADKYNVHVVRHIVGYIRGLILGESLYLICQPNLQNPYGRWRQNRSWEGELKTILSVFCHSIIHWTIN